MNAARSPEDHWSLDKRIPIAFLVAFLMQGGAFIWFAARYVARTEANTADIVAVKQDIRSLTVFDGTSGERITRLEVDYLASKGEVARRLDNIDDKLDRLLEAYRSPATRSEFGPANRAP